MLPENLYHYGSFLFTFKNFETHDQVGNISLESDEDQLDHQTNNDISTMNTCRLLDAS